MGASASAGSAASSSRKKAAEAAEAERLESEAWRAGSQDTSAKELEEKKRLEALAKKAERQALLEAEEAAVGGKAAKGDKKKPARAGGIDAFLAAGGGLAAAGAGGPVASYSASGIEAALDLLDLAAKDGASASDKLERHPEKRVKSAFAIFEEREMPILKAENPGLRLSQLKQALQKKWKKSPENPLNQAHVAYDTTREQEREAISTGREAALEKYQTK
ncbi:hypothetical protein HK105_205374 [Polyrhizophydium stewartii]|uniref:HMG box domain-containing protein n=1 Tax=Polyrhizophydium stewartii TaxID=2732419 RepID=A0ABR4N696_9FUNG